MEHTGEMELHVDAPSLTELFAEGARALATVMVRSRTRDEPGPARAVRLEANDLEALWVAWLNELIFLNEMDARVYWDAVVHRCSGHHLEATVRGTRFAHVDTAVKAATYHRLSLVGDNRGWHAECVLDV